MKREGWEIFLSDYILNCSKMPFEYGQLDCVCFASNAVMGMCGIDPMAEGRGLYSDLKTGAQLIKQYRGSFEGIFDFHFQRRTNVRTAQRGDVVLKVIQGEKTFGIVGNAGNAYFKSEGLGLQHCPVSECDIVWEIG